MSKLTIIARKVHRWLAYLVFAQITLWVLGGLIFATIPFESVIKGGDSVRPPAPPTIAAAQLHKIADYIATDESLIWLSNHQSSLGPVAKIAGPTDMHWLRLDTGQLATSASKETITQFAQSLYIGEGKHADTRHITSVEPRFLGLVDELYGRSDVWQVAFDDTLGTRLYFDSAAGVYLTVRNDFWVLYDAMWRLHIMDYTAGEDFNNLLLRVATPITLLFVLSGIVLTWTSARRWLLRRRSI